MNTYTAKCYIRRGKEKKTTSRGAALWEMDQLLAQGWEKVEDSK